MALKAYTLRLNSDNTITIRVERWVEYIDLESKTKAQVFDAVKYALISKGVNLSDETLTDDLHHLLRGE